MVSLGFVFSLYQSFVVAPNVQSMTRLLFEALSIQSHNERTEAFLIFLMTFGREIKQHSNWGWGYISHFSATCTTNVSVLCPELGKSIPMRQSFQATWLNCFKWVH